MSRIKLDDHMKKSQKEYAYQSTKTKTKTHAQKKLNSLLIDKEKDAEIQYKRIRKIEKETIANNDALSTNLALALFNAKNKKKNKKLYQVYLSNDLLIVIENFCRKNNMNKSAAAEMLLRLALGMEQI